MPTLSTAIQDYLLACEIEAKAKTTLSWYEYMLRPLKVRYPDLPLESVSTMIIRHVLAELKRQQKADETYANHVRVMKTFFAWAALEYRVENPMRHIKKPAIPRRIPEVISLRAVKALIDACEPNIEGLRNRAILYLLADTGIRSSGLRNLTISDLHLDESYIVVREKGKHMRIVPVSLRTVQHLRRWIIARPKSQFIFCSMGSASYGKQLTGSGLRLMLARLARRAHLPLDTPIHPHSFRHFAVLGMRQMGMDMGMVAQIIGHQNISTTINIYGQYAIDMLVQLHQRFSPLKLLEKPS